MVVKYSEASKGVDESRAHDEELDVHGQIHELDSAKLKSGELYGVRTMVLLELDPQVERRTELSAKEVAVEISSSEIYELP